MNFAVAALLLSGVFAQKSFSPRASFYLMSEDLNGWTQIEAILAIVGFVIFFGMYAFTVIYIFVDTYRRGVEYEELIENDKQTMTSLGMNYTTDDEFLQGLKDKIAGTKREDQGDDQLFGQASKLTEAQWKKGVRN